MSILWDTKIKAINGKLGSWCMRVTPDETHGRDIHPWNWTVYRTEAAAHGARGNGTSKTHEMAQHVAEEVARKLAKAFGGATEGDRPSWEEIPELRSGRRGNWKIEIDDTKWKVTKEGCPASAIGIHDPLKGSAVHDAEAAALALASVFGD